MGSQTLPPSAPGIRMAYSTRWVLPGMVATLVSYCSGARISSRIAPSWISPRMPRVLTPGEHLLQAAHVGGEGLHLAKALVHLLELLVDGLEAFGHPLLQSVLKLLVHRVAASRPACGCSQPGMPSCSRPWRGAAAPSAGCWPARGSADAAPGCAAGCPAPDRGWCSCSAQPSAASR